jgi:hypothetical protein
MGTPSIAGARVSGSCVAQRRSASSAAAIPILSAKTNPIATITTTTPTYSRLMSHMPTILSSRIVAHRQRLGACVRHCGWSRLPSPFCTVARLSHNWLTSVTRQGTLRSQRAWRAATLVCLAFAVAAWRLPLGGGVNGREKSHRGHAARGRSIALADSIGCCAISRLVALPAHCGACRLGDVSRWPAPGGCRARRIRHGIPVSDDDHRSPGWQKASGWLGSSRRTGAPSSGSPAGSRSHAGSAL